MRAIIYARVSTEEQKLYGYSLDAQIEVCKRYCEMKGWEVVYIYKGSKIITPREQASRIQPCN